MSAPSAATPTSVAPPTGSNQSLLLKSSPSYLWSNLSSSGTYLAYTHISEVHIISEVALTGKKVTSKKVQSKDGSSINHARWTKIAQKHYLVLATSSGVQIYDLECKLLFTQAFPALANGHKNPAFGVASYADVKNSYILVGSGTGSVHVFLVKKDISASEVLSNAHKHAITDIANSLDSTRPTEWCSCDTWGNVIVWRELNQICAINGLGAHDVATSIALRGDNVFVSNATGQIRIYNTLTRAKEIEIGAHSQMINSLALHPARDVFATVSDDCFLHVWSFLPATKEIKQLHSVNLPNLMLVGVQWCGDKANCLAATAYDCNQIPLWNNLLS